jgi:hypothetical protein
VERVLIVVVNDCQTFDIWTFGRDKAPAMLYGVISDDIASPELLAINGSKSTHHGNRPGRVVYLKLSCVVCEARVTSS